MSIHVFCTMGNTSVIVPEGVDVELSAIPIMGSRFDLTRSQYKQGAPVVRISGLVTMGNLTVRQARTSRQESRRELRGSASA